MGGGIKRGAKSPSPKTSPYFTLKAEYTAKAPLFVSLNPKNHVAISEPIETKEFSMYLQMLIEAFAYGRKNFMFSCQRILNSTIKDEDFIFVFINTVFKDDKIEVTFYGKSQPRTIIIDNFIEFYL